MEATILVTGASGYIGSQVVAALRGRGQSVIAATRRSSTDLALELGCEVVCCDLLAHHATKYLPSVDAIVHCATANDIACRDASTAMRLCVEGTQALLGHAVRVKAKKFIVFSTLQVYGTELVGEYDEGSSPVCESVYASSHLAAEQVCSEYSRGGSLATIAVRPANVFGVPLVSTVERSTLVPMCFVKQVVEHGRIVLHSSGRQRRNFVYIGDVANACVALLLESLEPGHHVRNITSGWYPTIREIADYTALAGIRAGYGTVAVISDNESPSSSNDFRISASPPVIPRGEVSTKRLMLETIDSLFPFFIA